MGDARRGSMNVCAKNVSNIRNLNIFYKRQIEAWHFLLSSNTYLKIKFIKKTGL